MKMTKTKALHCICCLTKNDLLLVASDKQKVINSLLNLKTTKIPDDYRICINCNSTLSCIDKFRQNTTRAHAILKACKLKSTFLSSVTDESVNSAFDTILNWMNDVTVILKYYMTDMKDEAIEEKENSEEESVNEEHEEPVHEESLFIGSVEGVGDIVKEEEMVVEALEEVHCKSEIRSDSGESSFGDETLDNEEMFSENDKKQIKTEQQHFQYEKKFRCDLCDKTYVLRADLIHHMNVHAGTNPYKCDIDGCTKSYPHPRTLKVHQREVHNVLNGVKVKPKPISTDPEFDQKLEELKDENFDIDKYYIEEKKGQKRPYQCRICSRFYNKTEFIHHRNLHLGLKPFECPDCDRTYTNPFELGKHYRKTHEAEGNREQNDSKEYDSENDKSLTNMDTSLSNTDDDTINYRMLEKYFVSERRGCRRAYQCPECKKLYSRGELKYHLNTHKNIKPYSCAIEDCNKTFCSPRDMRVHAKKFHKVRVKPVKDYSMKFVRGVYKREKVEKPSGEEYNKINVVCTVCGKSVRKKHFKEHYQIHIKADFSCPYDKQGCTEMFKNKMKLTSHIQAKHDPEYVPITTSSCMCEHCGKRLTKAQLKYHMNLHLGITPYSCDYPNCSEAYRSPNLLRQHIAGYHLKQMRFKCHYCSKRFNTKEEQDQHKMEDCGVKTATCHLCGRTMNKFSLKNHLLIHTGEKNFICDYEGCGKAFIRRDKLQQHKKQHSMENHYTCPSCNTGFKYKSWLDMHIQKKHPGMTEVINGVQVY